MPFGKARGVSVRAECMAAKTREKNASRASCGRNAADEKQQR